MTQTLVLLTVHDGVATVKLNDPARLNPLSLALQEQLLASFEQVRGDRSVRVLVLTGEGRGFCVGADLNSFSERPPGTEHLSPGELLDSMMERVTNRLVESLRSLPVPVLSVVNGPAAGAGVGLALAADICIAGSSAYFLLPFMPTLGILPDLGTSWVYPRTVGLARSAALMLLGERLSAADAASAGLIWRAVAEEELAAESARIVQKLTALPEQAALEIRAALEHARTHTLSEQLTYERKRQGALVELPSFSEGVLAFHQKRKPVFKRS